MGIGNGDTESRGCVFANFVATKLSTLPFYLLERNGRNSRPTSAFTALYSPRFTLGPRFHERPSVLIFGRHTTRVFASNGRFPSNYVDGGEFSAFSFLTTRVSRARVNRVDIIYFSEISFFSTHTLARTDFGRLSERGCLPRALESTGNDFLANFQRVRRLIFSLRAIRLQRIISVDTPFSPPFSFHLFLFSFLFFSAQRFYRKTFSPFQSTARDHPLSRSKIFSYSATKLFSHMAQYQYALRYLLQFSFKQCFRVL